MDGQINIFGVAPLKKRKPCEYSFTRYEGQRVRDHRGEHIIAAVEGFYTIYTDGTVGTPHGMSPIDQSEFKASLLTELEYNEHIFAKDRDSVAGHNIEIIKKLLEEIDKGGRNA